MTEAYTRPDGRGRKQLRDLSVEVGNLERAEGSSRVHLGKNIAIATVFGPREMHPKHAARSDRAVVRINYRMATFSVDGYKRSYPSRREKEISKVLSEAFESVVLTKNWPRSVVDVHIEIFQSDGGTRTAAAIAITAALADAGIPMRDLTGGIASGLYEDQVCLDLSGHEDMKGTGDMPILYSPSVDEVSLFQLDGQFTFDQFKEAFYTSMEGIKEIVGVIREALKQKYVVIREQYGVDDEDEDLQSYDDDDAGEDDFDDEDDQEEDDEELPKASSVTKDPSLLESDKPISSNFVNMAAKSSPEPVSETVTDSDSATTDESEGVADTISASAADSPTEVAPTTITGTEPASETTIDTSSDDGESEDESEEEGDEISNTWFNKPGTELKPMNTSDSDDEEDNNEETSSVMRDLEYSEEE